MRARTYSRSGVRSFYVKQVHLVDLDPNATVAACGVSAPDTILTQQKRDVTCKRCKRYV